MFLIYVFWGEDEYSREEALQNIKSKLGDLSLLSTNTNVLDGNKLTLNELKACAEAMPFLAEKRLVIIKGLIERYESKAGTGKAKKSTSANTKLDEIQELITCIKGLPPSTILVLTDNIEVKKSSLQNNLLYKGILDKAEIKSFPLLKGIKLSQWIEERVNKRGASISHQATGIMAELIGGDLLTINNEINKLTAFTAGRRIEEKDVRMVVSAAQEADIFTMVDAIIDQKSAIAEQILQSLIRNGVAPAQILVLIARQIQMMVQIKDLKAQKKSLSEIQSRMGISYGFIWEKIFSRSEKYTMEGLKRTYKIILDTDIAIKTGKFEGDLAMDIMVADLCAGS
jgi:DNA polymerase III subunit delta